MENKNQPANPATIHKVKGEEIETVSFPGLSKREYFAGLAMQALITNPNIQRPKRPFVDEGADHSNFASVAIEYADSLLKRLES